MRDLLTEHAEVLLGAKAGAGTSSAVSGSLAFADQLLAANPAYARANPQIAERIKMIKGQDRHYVAHELLQPRLAAHGFCQDGAVAGVDPSCNGPVRPLPETPSMR